MFENKSTKEILAIFIIVLVCLSMLGVPILCAVFLHNTSSSNTTMSHNFNSTSMHKHKNFTKVIADPTKDLVTDLLSVRNTTEQPTTEQTCNSIYEEIVSSSIINNVYNCVKKKVFFKKDKKNKHRSGALYSRIIYLFLFALKGAE